MSMIRCDRCGRVQTARPNCVRCEALLPDPPPEPVVVERVAERVIEKVVHVADRCPVCALRGIPTMDEAERALIYSALRACNGGRTKAAAMLGIGKTTLYRKLAEYEASYVQEESQ